jgi:hypothetical protein
MYMLGRVAALCSVLLISAACANCPRTGCDALSSPAGGSGTGIAGAIASESDVVGNGCQDCPFGSTQLTVWKTSSPIPDEATARAIVGASGPTVSFHADGRYEQLLDPGDYLLCSNPYCTAIQVDPDQVTTVHVKLINGPAQFIIFDPGTTTARSASVFEVLQAGP